MWLCFVFLFIYSIVYAEKSDLQEDDDAPVFKRQASDYVDLDIDGPRLSSSASGYSSGRGYGSTSEGNSGFSTNGGNSGFSTNGGNSGFSTNGGFQSIKPSRNGQEEQQDQSSTEDMPYSFEWSVNDQSSGNQYSHKQSSDGKITMGEYSVLLPDQRIQTVRFVADDINGYVADVSYSGDPVFPETRVSSGASNRGAGARALSERVEGRKNDANKKQTNESKKKGVGKEPIFYGNFGIQSRSFESGKENSQFGTDRSNTMNQQKIQQLKHMFGAKNYSGTFNNYNASRIGGRALNGQTFLTEDEDGIRGRSYEDGINLWEAPSKDEVEDKENILYSKTANSHTSVRKGVNNGQTKEESLQEVENSIAYHNKDSNKQVSKGAYHKDDLKGELAIEGELEVTEQQSTTIPPDEYSPLDKVTIYAEFDDSTTEAYDYVTEEQYETWSVTPTTESATATEEMEVFDQENVTSVDIEKKQEVTERIEDGRNKSKQKFSYNFQTKYYPKPVTFPTTATQPERGFRSKVTSNPNTRKSTAYKRPYIQKTRTLPKTAFEHFKKSNGKNNSRLTPKWVKKHMAEKQETFNDVNTDVKPKTGSELQTENSSHDNAAIVKNPAIQGKVVFPKKIESDSTAPSYIKDIRTEPNAGTVTKIPIHTSKVQMENWLASTPTPDGRAVIKDKESFGSNVSTEASDQHNYEGLHTKRRFGSPRFINRQSYPRRNYGNRLLQQLNYWRPMHDRKTPIYARENNTPEGNENIDLAKRGSDIYANQFIVKPMLGEVQGIAPPTLEYVFPTHIVENQPMIMTELLPRHDRPGRSSESQQYHYENLNGKEEGENIEAGYHRTYYDMPETAGNIQNHVYKQQQTDTQILPIKYGKVEGGSKYQTASWMPAFEQDLPRNGLKENTDIYNNGDKVVYSLTGRNSYTDSIDIKNEGHIEDKIESNRSKQRMAEILNVIAGSRRRQSFNPNYSANIFGKPGSDLEVIPVIYPKTAYNAYKPEDINAGNRRKSFVPRNTDTDNNPTINVKVQSKLQYGKQGNSEAGKGFISEPEALDNSRFGNTASEVVYRYTNALTGIRRDEGKETAEANKRNVYNKVNVLQQPHHNAHLENSSMQPQEIKTKTPQPVFPSYYSSRNVKVKHNNDWYGIVPNEDHRELYKEQRPDDRRHQSHMEEKILEQPYYQNQNHNLEQPNQGETTYREGRSDETRFLQDTTNNRYVLMDIDDRYDNANINNKYESVETDGVTIKPKSWVLNIDIENVTQGQVEDLIDRPFSIPTDDDIAASAESYNYHGNLSSNNETADPSIPALPSHQTNEITEENERLRELVEKYATQSPITTSPHSSTKSFGDKLVITELNEKRSSYTNVGDLDLATNGPIVHTTTSQSATTSTPLYHPPVFQHNNSVS